VSLLDQASFLVSSTVIGNNERSCGHFVRDVWQIEKSLSEAGAIDEFSDIEIVLNDPSRLRVGCSRRPNFMSSHETVSENSHSNIVLSFNELLISLSACDVTGAFNLIFLSKNGSAFGTSDSQLSSDNHGFPMKSPIISHGTALLILMRLIVHCHCVT
jgi:hypothetical protein